MFAILAASLGAVSAGLAAPPPAPGAIRVSIWSLSENGEPNPDASAFPVGNRLTVAVVAEDVPPPGLFGGQFELHFDPAVLRVVENSLHPGPALNPALVVEADVDATAGRVIFAASRQGDVDNLAGTVQLATLTFEAIAATGPQSTTLALDSMTLGRRGGQPLPLALPAPLPIHIITAEATPAPAALFGTILLEGNPNPPGDVTVTAKNADGEEFSLPADAAGNFLFDDLPPGSYRISARSPGFLAAICPDAAHTAPGPTHLAGITLLAGDVDGDDNINIADAVSLGAALGHTNSQPTTDLNRDSRVDVLDVILLAANFGQSSAAVPWHCSP